MTTAYENYAVKAFEVNSVDYLLKPIDLPMLSRAIQRCRDAKDHSNIDKILDALSGKPLYRERYMIRINDRIMPVNVSDIAWFESVSKSSYVMLRSGMRYIINPSLDEAEAQLNPRLFQDFAQLHRCKEFHKKHYKVKRQQVAFGNRAQGNWRFRALA